MGRGVGWGWIWRRRGRGEYLKLACLLAWQDSPVGSQGIPTVAEDWDNGMCWGKEVWRERSV